MCGIKILARTVTVNNVKSVRLACAAVLFFLAQGCKSAADHPLLVHGSALLQSMLQPCAGLDAVGEVGTTDQPAVPLGKQHGTGEQVGLLDQGGRDVLVGEVVSAAGRFATVPGNVFERQVHGLPPFWFWSAGWLPQGAWDWINKRCSLAA